MPLNECPRCHARFRGDITACPIDGQTLQRPTDPIIGTTVAGRYLVEECLGTGGMGSVYRARHQFIGRDVALKFLDPALTQNERLRKRFLGEARAANQINHEHIIDITDFGETEDGMVYMVMEYLQGHSLEEEIERGPVELRRALRIALQVALGLGRAHELGVVHRDIKPANIFLTRRGMNRDFVKILDFGVARIEQDSRITGANMIVGTPEYIAPEQIRAAGATPAADLYSLGCVLFEMLTGKIPFEGKTTVLLVKHINETPASPSSINTRLPREADRLVLKLLQKKPEDRHRDAYHLVEELQRLLDSLPGIEASGRPKKRPTPSSAPAQLVILAEEEGWATTARLYRELFREAHARDKPPEWLPDSIRAIEDEVAEIRALRKRLTVAAEAVTAQEEQVRGPRKQIGIALDALAQDDSRLGRQILELAEHIEPVQSQLDAAFHALMTSTKSSSMRLRAGDVVGTEDEQALREVARGAGELAMARDELHALHQRLARKKAERKDLRYQIDQLKHQLEQLNHSSTLDKEVFHDDVRRLSAKIQERLESIAPIAKRIAGHFARFPELKDRVGRSHAPITMSGDSAG